MEVKKNNGNIKFIYVVWKWNILDDICEYIIGIYSLKILLSVEVDRGKHYVWIRFLIAQGLGGILPGRLVPS